MKREELQIFVDIQRTILDAGLDLPDILEVILVSGLKLIQQTHGEIFLLEKNGKQLRIVRSTDQQDEGKVFDLDKCFAGLAVIMMKTVFCPDSSTELLYQSPHSGPYHSELTVPLRVRNKVVGAINIESNKVNAFDAEAITLLEYFAGTAAIAILNAERFAALERANDQLIELDNKVLGGIKNIITDRFHALGNWLSGIRVYMLEIYKQDLSNLSERSKNTFEEVISSFETSLNLIYQSEQFLIQYVEAEKVNLDIREILQQSIIEMGPTPDNIKIEISTATELMLIRGNRQRIGSMIREFLSNSIEAMPHGGIIKMDAYNEANSVILIVKDEGVGITTDVMNNLFNVGYSTKGHKGLGLFGVYMIVKTHRGTITCESSEGKGTTFKISFPAINSHSAF